MHDPSSRGVLVEQTTDDATLTRLAGAWIASYPSEHTRRGYRQTLYDWFTWCRAYQLDPLDVRRTHLELWLRHQESRELAPSTRANYIARVRSWYVWLVDEDIIPANPAARLRRPQEELSPQPAYSRTEMARLLEAANDAGGYDLATILLLYANGLRVSEVCGADVADLGTERYHRTLKIDGKGNKVATVPLPPATSLAVDQALDGRQTGPLLLTRVNGRACRSSVVRTIRRLAKAAGVSAHGPHALRRTVIQLMLAEGRSLREVQVFARHADPKTTARYDLRVRSMEEHLSQDALRLVA